MDIKTSDIFCEEFRERYRKDGFSEQEIDKIQQDTIYFRKMYLQKSEQREITCGTYIRSRKKIDKRVKDWFCGMQC
jgi:hypothetical protein